MLPVEAEVRLLVRVRAEGLEINDLAAWGFRAKDGWCEYVLSEVIWEIQERHLESVLAGERELACTGCGVVHVGLGGLLRRGSRARQVRTSNGRLRFRLRQVTCADCRKTWSPFAELLGLQPGQRILEELTRRLVDWVTELSYRKTCRLGRAFLGDAPSPKTLHARVQEKGETLEFTEAEPFETLVGDGTKVPAGRKPRGEDLTVVFQIQGRREVNGRPAVAKRVVGVGIGHGSWQEALATAGDPTLVVTDAETGVRELVARYFPEARHQLCEWHVPYTLAHTLGLEGMRVEERKAVAGKLSGLLSRGDPRALTFAAERLEGYPRSQAYLRSVAPYVLYSPPSRERTTSVMEREMREINRRTDVGARWSIPGVRNLSCLRLAQRHNPDDYERLWAPLRTCHSTLVPQT